MPNESVGIDWIRNLAEIALAGSAIVAAYVAVKGLDAWRQQLQGQSEYELAKRLLISLYKYRQSIENIRDPAISYYVEEGAADTLELRKFNGLSDYYQQRLKNSGEIVISMNADLLEAEAYWEKELEPQYDQLVKLHRELQHQVSYYLRTQNPNLSEDDRKYAENSYGKPRDIMYSGYPPQEDDAFKTEFDTGVRAIEEFLKPILSPNKQTTILSRMLKKFDKSR